jgi:hypothetical protein
MTYGMILLRPQRKPRYDPGRPGLAFGSTSTWKATAQLSSPMPCKMGLEDILSKRKDSTYSSGRSPDWLMIYGPKNDGTYIVEFKTSEARRWRSACPLERPACSSTSRGGCLTDFLCRMCREEPLAHRCVAQSGALTQSFASNPPMRVSETPPLLLFGRGSRL